MRLKYFTRNSAYLLKNRELPIFEYFFGIILFYRNLNLVQGWKSIPILIKIYFSFTFKGFLGKLGKL